MGGNFITIWYIVKFKKISLKWHNGIQYSLARMFFGWASSRFFAEILIGQKHGRGGRGLLCMTYSATLKKPFYLVKMIYIINYLKTYRGSIQITPLPHIIIDKRDGLSVILTVNGDIMN